VQKHKNILRQFLEGHGGEVQKSIAVALTLLDKENAMNAIRIEDGLVKCPICHTNVSNHYCPNCGRRISYGG